MTLCSWPPQARTKHLYIPGMSGYGKTTLMANLAIQDIIHTEDPVIVIDPKGSAEGLVERILPFIPKHRINDVVYLSQRKPVPIDLLSYRDDYEKSLVTADIISTLKRFSYGSWGPTMQGTLRKLLPTLLEAPNATFLDIGAFLESKDRREKILKQVSLERNDYWRENPPSKSDVGPIATRIANFEEPPLRTIVDSRRGQGINIVELIEQNKILLVDTSPLTEDGLIIGALVMSRVQQAIFRREPDRSYRCCHIYADEFQNFLTSAFNVMLSQARSFNLSLCLANQHPKQISEIWDDITGCVSSYVIFRMDGQHAIMLKSKIKDPEFKPPPPIPDLPTRELIGFKKMFEDAFMERGMRAEAHKCAVERTALEEQLREKERARTQKPPSYLDRIPFLNIGEAIYISHNGTTHRIKTPPMKPAPHPNYVQQILNAPFAESSQIRTVDDAPSNSPHSSHNEGNAPWYDKPEPPTSQDKSEA